MNLSVSHIGLFGEKDFIGMHRERILLKEMFQQRNILLQDVDDQLVYQHKTN